MITGILLSRRFQGFYLSIDLEPGFLEFKSISGDHLKPNLHHLKFLGQKKKITNDLVDLI